MFGGENFEEEVDRGTGRSGGDWHRGGRFPSLEAIKPVGRKTSGRKERCCGTVPVHSVGQCPPLFSEPFRIKKAVSELFRKKWIGAAFGGLVPGDGAYESNYPRAATVFRVMQVAPIS